MELKRVVVTGLGAVTPLGNTVPELWDSVVNGRSGAARITLFDPEKFRTQFACEVKNFDASQFIDRKELRKMERYEHFAMVAAEQAIADCGIALEQTNRDRIGVIFGVGIGGLKAYEEEMLSYAETGKTIGPRFNPFLMTKLIPNMAAGFVSIKYGLRGPNFATTAACASSNLAMAEAANYIRLGKADAMVVGGAEAVITESCIGAFNSMKALSTNNENAATASRPFSHSRDGFVLGEGSAVLILEEYEHAVARGAKIYAELAGYGLSADAYHMTAPEPEGEGAALVMRNALDDANLTTADIDYINLHGTSTPLGDVAEMRAVKAVFGADAYRLNLSSTKSMTGHLLGGAGALEAVISILAMNNNIVPPTINFTEGDEDPDVDYKLNFTFNHAQKREIRAVLSNTFGFGGHNAAVIFKKVRS